MQQRIIKIERADSFPDGQSAPRNFFQGWFWVDPDTIIGGANPWQIGGLRMLNRCKNAEISAKEVREIIAEYNGCQAQCWVVWLLAKNPSFSVLCLEDPALSTCLATAFILLTCLYFDYNCSYKREHINVIWLGGIYAQYGGHEEIREVISRYIGAPIIEHYLEDYGKAISSEDRRVLPQSTEEWCQSNELPWVMPLLLGSKPPAQEERQ